MNRQDTITVHGPETRYHHCTWTRDRQDTITVHGPDTDKIPSLYMDQRQTRHHHYTLDIDRQDITVYGPETRYHH